MHLQDQDIEAKLKPVQELKCSDFLRLQAVQPEMFRRRKKELYRGD